MTKKECLLALKELSAVKDNPDLTKYVENELLLLEKKKNSASKKRTAHQEENEKYKEIIYDILLESPNRLFAFSEIADFHELPSDDFSGQRVTFLLTSLVNEGRIERVKEKKKSFYKILLTK